MSTTLERLQKRIMKLEIITASLLLFLPLILISIDNTVRSSISDYAYMNNNQWFVSLITVSAMMFIINGSQNNKRWYNILLGISLFIVGITPYLDYPIWHTVSSALFFGGGVFAMIFYSSKAQRLYKIYAGVFIALAMLGSFLLGFYSLFFAEWIAMLPICIHFIGESKGIID